jgi:soluble P-type ATPase
VKFTIAPVESQAETKLAYITSLGFENAVAIGNGRNDRKMIEAASLGIALIQREGGSIETLTKADITLTSILDVLDLFNNPKRLITTLRS